MKSAAELAGKPTVFVDARMVSETPHGFARYVSALAKGMKSMGELPYELAFLVSQEFKSDDFFGFRAVRARSRFLSLGELTEIPSLLGRMKASAYHSPSFSSFFGLPCPYAVTVHDLNHLKFGSLDKKLYYRFILKKFIRGAAAKITVSEFSRNELSQWTGLPSEQFQIVHNAFDSSWVERVADAKVKEVLGKFELSAGSYFYCATNPKPHKNVPRLVDAYRDWRIGKNSWPLVLTLQGFENEPGIRCVGAITHEEGRALLQGAGAVVFPSLYEGFGLPPVEAALMGIRVGISDIPPHREAVQDLAPSEVLWVDPLQTRAWTQAFEQLFQGKVEPSSPSTREKILARFSIEKMARHMDQIYRGMLGLRS